MTSTFRALPSQRGATAVEFAIVATLFLVLLFGLIELARIMYVFNTLQEVTRRAASRAAVTSFRDSAELDKIRLDAVFLTTSGTLLLGGPVTDQHVTIDYLAQTSTAPGNLTMEPISDGSLPSCAARNRQICMSNPYDPQCVRFVRVRICQPGSGAACTPVMYQPIMPLINLSVPLPASTTIVPIESLGFTVGDAPC